jgi:lipopolysaccharide export system permease protein
LHERLVNPLYPIAFAFLIVAFVGQARSTRSNRLNGLLAAFLIGALCRLLGLALTNAVARNPALVAPLYAMPLGVIVLSLLLIKGAEHQKSGLAVVDKAVDACATAFVGLQRFLGRYGRRKAIP